MARRCLCAACDSGTALQDVREEKNRRGPGNNRAEKASVTIAVSNKTVKRAGLTEEKLKEKQVFKSDESNSSVRVGCLCDWIHIPCAQNPKCVVDVEFF